MAEVPAWVLLALGLALLAAEIAALLTPKRGDTISERLRALLGVEPRRWWRPIGVIAAVGFLAWFAVHLSAD